jgi:3,4-dihydroxy 2-butanone 4-phosphate synthase/GTP cyclohydrolase II
MTAPHTLELPRALHIERVERAIDEIRAGRMVVLVDDEDRENEGDLCMAAQRCTPEAVNFMARHGRGLICLTLTDDHLRRLGLTMMVSENRAPMGTAFTVSIDAADGITTGISAADRARTVQVAVAPEATQRDIVTPGHVFPIRARDGGVLVRTGQTEGSVDLARLAGLAPAGVICEILNDDGTMARMPDLEAFARAHGLCIVTIADLISYRLQRESMVRRSPPRVVRTEPWGEFTLYAFESDLEPLVHLALVRGVIDADRPTLVRVHAENVLTDVFGVADGARGNLLRGAMDRICAEGSGVLLYLQRSQHPQRTTTRAERGSRSMVMRTIGIGCQILSMLGVHDIRLLTNTPHRMPALDGYGLRIVEEVPVAT